MLGQGKNYSVIVTPHAIAVWMPVERSAMVPFNLEASPLQIKTDSTDGSLQFSQVTFYTGEGQEVGSVLIYFDDPPKYTINDCRSIPHPFLDTLSSDVNKVWTISKLEGPRITIKCNEVTVADLLMSDGTCDDPSWKTWLKDIEEIKFNDYDDASDGYRAAAPGNLLTISQRWQARPLFL